MQTVIEWSCFPFIRSGENHLARHRERGGGRIQGRQRKRWEDNITEWRGLEFGRSQKAMENREKWTKLVAKLSVVPKRPSRLRDRWWWWWWHAENISYFVFKHFLSLKCLQVQIDTRPVDPSDSGRKKRYCVCLSVKKNQRDTCLSTTFIRLWLVCPSVAYLPVCLIVCLSVSLITCLSVSLHPCLSLWLSVCLCLCFFVCLFDVVFVCLCLPLCLPDCPDEISLSAGLC